MALENSVRASRVTQLHFFPDSLPALQGVDLAAVNIPSDVISGDYFDFSELLKVTGVSSSAMLRGRGFPRG
jgi:hypothetical protein